MRGAIGTDSMAVAIPLVSEVWHISVQFTVKRPHYSHSFSGTVCLLSFKLCLFCFKRFEPLVFLFCFAYVFKRLTLL